MYESEYPVLEVDLSAIRHNAEVICDIYRKQNIAVAGVVKISDGSPDIAKAYLDGGCRELASSRIGHLAQLKPMFPGVDTMLLRIPQLCEIRDVAEYADICLVSEKRTLEALEKAAGDFQKRQKVVLMLDVGDRREGVLSVDDLLELTSFIKHNDHLWLSGIGTNYGCVSGVMPDDENLQFLNDAAKAVEAEWGQPLEIVSGGGSSSLIRTCAGLYFPKKINHIRVGGSIANPVNMIINRHISIPGINIDTFRLRAQVVEVKDKPGATGHGRNWMGQEVDLSGEGVRRRAIAALGAQDIGDPFNLLPMDENIRVVGGSSDHTVLDVTESTAPVEVGSVIDFRLRYGAVLTAFSTRHVRREIFKKWS